MIKKRQRNCKSVPVHRKVDNINSIYAKESELNSAGSFLFSFILVAPHIVKTVCFGIYDGKQSNLQLHLLKVLK
ncbi:hypothetical protein HNQ34_000606 [Anoxybacillus tepidamans]|uniref:Uncharacterized protein n=1 Tax=Anoxybacteroides tepidamans TaxID=265948 RepID=A0A7W8IPU0_9BACL|nr:hypothetical protein [Anoxybacillus tepidamans]